jgi:hypothetical protein
MLDVSETGICLRHQVNLIMLDPIDRASPDIGT